MANLTFRALGPETFEDFVGMHSRAECGGCFCMYWHFEADNRAWQGAVPEQNLAAKRQRVTAGTTHGFLAYAEGQVVGSLQFEPRDTLKKLLARMPYRDLGPDTSVWSITCFRVVESHRRAGVARALLGAAVAHIGSVHGATAIEAYPRRGEDLRDEEVWTGPESLFASAGFAVVREHVQYPVVRLTVRKEATNQ